MVWIPFQPQLTNWSTENKILPAAHCNYTPLWMHRIRNVLHVCLVVVANLLDADVILGLNVGFGGGIGPGQSHHADDVLEILLILHFDLQGNWLVKRDDGIMTGHWVLTLPRRLGTPSCCIERLRRVDCGCRLSGNDARLWHKTPVPHFHQKIFLFCFVLIIRW